MNPEWAEMAARSAKEVASTFGFERCEERARVEGLPTGLGGAFIPLVGECMCVQLGVLAEVDAQAALARKVLQMEPDEDLDLEYVRDALGELANCIVGKVKSALRLRDATLRIGLPMIIDGTVEQMAGARYTTLDLAMDGVPVSVTMFVDVRS